MIQNLYSRQKSLSLFGNGSYFVTGVYAVSVANHLVSPTAYSHSQNHDSILSEVTPINKLPSYVLGFASILIVAAVKAATIFSIKSPNLLSSLNNNIDPRGISVLSLANKVSVNIMVIGRMVYENASKLKLRRFLKLSMSLPTTFSYFSLRAF